MGNNNNDNNNTIKIISWNVNAFCNTKNWNDLSTEELKNEQNKNYLQILEKIKGLLEIIGENGVLFLQEIPKMVIKDLDKLNKLSSDNKIEKNGALFLQEMPKELVQILSELLLNYKIEKNFDKKHPKTSTIAIYKKSSNWENETFNTSKAIYKKKESVYYYNRCVLLKSDLLQIQILGVHIPSAYRDPTALLLWDDIIEFARTKEPLIIIGDFNADAEDTPQWRCMKELMNLDKRQNNYYPKRNPKYATYIEPEGDAKRKKIGDPKTYHYKNEKGKEEGSHVDYALIREDSKSKFTVEKYRILTDYKEYSDHYPIMLEINLNNDTEEA